MAKKTNKKFFHWAREKYHDSISPEGEFVREMVSDRHFPWLHSRALNKTSLISYGENVTEYFLSSGHEPGKAITWFVILYDEYCREYLGIDIFEEKRNGQGNIPHLSIVRPLERSERETEEV